MAYGVAVKVMYRGDGRGTVEKASQTEVETPMVGLYPSVELNFKVVIVTNVLSHSDRFTMGDAPGLKIRFPNSRMGERPRRKFKKNEI
jgi:hypothetical protein